MATGIQLVDTAEVRRFARFLVVGAAGTLLDFSLLTALKTLGMPTLIANTLSFSAGVANNFTWNRAWTFADARRSAWHTQLLQFLTVSLVGLILNNTIVLLLEHPLGTLLPRPELGYVPAKVIATMVVVFWNYFANRTWTFK